MNLSDQMEPQTHDTHPSERGRDPAARMAGGLLILTALATLIAVIGRVSADADQATMAESLTAISRSGGLYGLGGAARLLSGITLIAGACYLTKTWIIRERLGTPLVPYLFAASGVFTAISGACAVALAISAPPPPPPGEFVVLSTISPMLETMADLRWLTGKVGFAIAGIALIVASGYQWKVGGNLRRIAPVSAVLGIAMQFIWIDAATIMHPVIGSLFFVWLLVIGTMLFTGRVERHFIASLEAKRR